VDAGAIERFLWYTHLEKLTGDGPVVADGARAIWLSTAAVQIPLFAATSSRSVTRVGRVLFPRELDIGNPPFAPIVRRGVRPASGCNGMNRPQMFVCRDRICRPSI
jgi:hypothetical protein